MCGRLWEVYSVRDMVYYGVYSLGWLQQNKQFSKLW